MERKTDWLLKIKSFNKDSEETVTYETLFDMYYEDVLEEARSIASDKVLVRIYELKCKICFGVEIKS